MIILKRELNLFFKDENDLLNVLIKDKFYKQAYQQVTNGMNESEIEVELQDENENIVGKIYWDNEEDYHSNNDFIIKINN